MMDIRRRYVIGYNVLNLKMKWIQTMDPIEVGIWFVPRYVYRRRASIFINLKEIFVEQIQRKRILFY